VQLRTVPRPPGRFPVSEWVSDAVYLRLSVGDAVPDHRVVLYLDVDLLVLWDLFNRCRHFLDKYPQHARFWDQDALNWAADDRWSRLDRRWNTFRSRPCPAYRSTKTTPRTSCQCASTSPERGPSLAYPGIDHA
jgi:lipopolysaccharide biosynthesis glycosyltransferase